MKKRRVGADEPDGDTAIDTDLDQIVERLSWTPKQRLTYLIDMLAFEGRARGAWRSKFAHLRRAGEHISLAVTLCARPASSFVKAKV